MPPAKSELEQARRPCAGRPIVGALLPWFDENARDLPWRRTVDPYAIWVSEIMLQQTQVGTVIPYWERWMRALPDIRSLANAKPEKIHKLWEGLGYYTRVRNMQRAAQQVIEEHGGVFPSAYEQVLALPGVGRYTAGAICSIAFNQPTPILDGNVIRVLSRVFMVRGDAREKRVNARLWAIAADLVQTAEREHRPGANRCSRLNQSLMELGALICTPRTPACPRCPLSALCQARRRGRVAEFPQPRKRPQTEHHHAAAFVVRNGDNFLVRQRPAGTANGHLWEFPGGNLNGADVATLARSILKVRPGGMSHLLTVKHSITRFRITLDAWELHFNNGRLPVLPAGAWVTRTELDRLALPSAHRKIAAILCVRNGKTGKNTARQSRDRN